MHSAWLRSTFLRVLKFLQIKEWGPNFCREPILQKVWIIWPPLLYFNFKSLKYRISSSFIRFECILHDSAVFFWESSNFYKLKGGNLISGGSHFCRKSELFGPPFCISILKILWTQIFRHSLDFNAFFMIQDYFSQSFAISTNWRGGTEFLEETSLAESLNYLVPPFCISLLKVLWTQIFRHSLDLNAFSMIQEHFPQSFEISTN